MLFFYAAPSITIPYLQLKLPTKVSYLMLVEPLKVLISLSLSVLYPEWETSSLSSSHSTSFTYST